MIPPRGEGLIRAQHRDGRPFTQHIHSYELIGMSEIDPALNRPCQARDDLVRVVSLPAPLGDLHAPGLTLGDLAAYLVFEQLAYGVEIGVAPVVHWNPFDREAERVALIGEDAAPAHDFPWGERGVRECDSINARAFDLRVIVTEAAEYSESFAPCAPETPAIVRNYYVHAHAVAS